ncbi:ATP-dependent DNA helicase RRM3-like [Apium graveolens]|uniref:ATP-dependent DNA helicase RRM3-like n=1 Tax=Apium graveolens TaxID=4045 RepID=UPI003D79D11E
MSDELSYNKEHEHDEHDKLYKSLNKEQLHAYASIIDTVENGKGGIFFVYGSGGCGKTFLYNTLYCKLRSVGRVVLPVATSGIAALLLPGGRTTHSRFHIPLKVDEYSVVGIKHGTELGELLKQTSLIIWDEAPMQHRHAAESVDRSLRDIMTSLDPERASLPFGGITIIFGGDFRKILPVIPKALRAQVVSASLNISKIWDRCRVFLLEKNLRLSSGKTEQEKHEIAEFSKWVVLDVGNGTLPNVHPDDMISDPEVVIPDKFLIRARENPLKDVVDVVYPDLAKNIENADYLRERSILTPTNAIVGDINSYILDQAPGKEHSYLVKIPW